MKQSVFFFLFITLCSTLYCQNFEKQIIHVDTMSCSNDSTGTDGEFSQINISCVYALENGFNRIYNQSGELAIEGVVTKKGKYPLRIGQWIYYKNGIISEIITSNHKGVIISEIRFYDNGKLRSKEFKFGKNKAVNEYYLPDGEIVKNKDGLERFIYIQNKK
ncbi:MAG: hypothetical protein KDD24_01485 [Flavobacteriales bacterium]|nr:hypothetical protein [Flavobacteriales bacterium]MCB9174485.1 hypothetical protein [Flavobacteriales bacterium]